MMQDDEYASMAQLEGTHWWYRSLHEHTLRSLKKLGVKNDAAILDAACGTGGMMRFLDEHGYSNISGFDLSDTAIRFTADNGFRVQKGDLRTLKDIDPNERWDVILCMDALYFLTEDEQKKFLHDCAKRLKPGGVVILNIPAMKLFSGSHDHVVGITRRLNKASLKSLVDQHEFQITEIRYWPFLLAPAIALIRKISVSGSKARSDLKQEPRWLNSLLYRITQLDLNRIAFSFIGSSLFLVLRLAGNK